MDFSTYLFRCSSLGHIMTEPKGDTNLEKYNKAVAARAKAIVDRNNCSEKAIKTFQKLQDKIWDLDERILKLEPIKDEPLLSDGCKTHLCDIYTRMKYNRIEDIRSKYLEKGLEMEEDAITAYSLLTGEFHKKNKVRLANEFIDGELDFEDEEMVLDAKVNWSVYQFTRVAAKPIKPLYDWQIRGYMWLTGKPKGRLVYALLNTPEHLIQIEEKKLLYDFVGSTDDYKEACKELRHLHTYDDIPLEEKIRTFDIQHDDEMIEKLKTRIIACRNYLNNIENLKKITDGTAEVED